MHRLLFVIVGLAASVYGAGDADGRNSAPDAQKLHLQPGELPRHGAAPGPGLVNNSIVADVVVAGGGSAGVSAALAAARSGARTVLIHGRPVLGGNSGSEIKLSMVGACGPRAGNNPMRLECREGGIVEEYTLDNAVGNPNRVAELFSLELYNKMLQEPNIKLYLNTWLVSVEKDGSRITRAIAEDQMSQNRYIIDAKVFIDTTGDGRLGAEAGTAYLMGREGPSEYNESLAEGPDTETEGSSLAWVAEDMGTPQPFTPPPWAEKFNASTFKYRNVDFFQYGYWWNEVSWPYQTVNDNLAIYHQLLANLFGIWDFIKNSGYHPTSETWALTWFGNVPCKREGRRFVGQYVSSQNDIMKDPNASPPQAPELYFDRVAYSGWNFDLHNPKGMFDPNHAPYSSYRVPYMFSTPLRSLTSKDVPNLLFAGRLASFSHVVFGSQRVMKTGSTMGQAVGTAAAFAVQAGVDPANITSDPDMMWRVQQQLLRDDAYIIGLVNEDPRDLARTAVVTASSETQTSTLNGTAVNVISGQTRAVVTPLTSSNEVGGVAEGQGIPGANRWVSQGLPASLQLKLKQPAAVAQAQLIFDTGMHRKLSFSVRQGGVGTWSAQPETVRDYTIEGHGPKGWELLCNITDNFQRRRVHNLPCSPIHPAPSWPPLHPGNHSGPSPSPPSPVAGLPLSMVTCDATAVTQRFHMNADGQIESLSQPRQCVAYDKAHAAQGAHGQAITLLPCASSPRWSFDPRQANGSAIKLPAPIACINYQGTCQCLKGVNSGQGKMPAGTSVELWSCQGDSGEEVFQQLQLTDAVNASMLSSSGLCLDAQPPVIGAGRRAQEAGQLMADSADATYASIRVNVTATNGIADAHIVEVRLYDEAAIMETVHSVLDMLQPHATALAVGAACAAGLYALSLPRPYYDFNKVCGQFDAANLSQDPYFFDKTQYEWVPMVEAGWRTVREELEAFLQRKELIPYFGENLMTRKQCWKVLGLKFWGLNHTEHQGHFPRTMELLNKVPGLSLVAFSQIEAGSAITPHNGDTNANIRCHLGLVVPGELPDIGFRVGTEEHSWREGELLMFCDAHRHTAFNYTDKTRIILQFDVIRPEYQRVETLASARVLASICTQKIMLHTLPFIRGRKWALRLVYYSLIPLLLIPIWTPFLNQWLFDFFTDKAKAPDRKPEESA